MNNLMPQYELRRCDHCGYTFGTAYPGAMACPFCSKALADASGVWSHCCSQGHGATHSGDCEECREGKR